MSVTVTCFSRKLLAELAAEGTNVDFVLVDGDHSAAGAERDVRDLLSSEAVRRTVVVLHDTLNDEVRAGLQRIDFAAEPIVAHVELDFMGGHLSYGGGFHHQLWGGLGLVVIDRGLPPSLGSDQRTESFYDLFELIAPVRDALVARERSGSPTGPGTVRAAVADASSTRRELGQLRAELERTRGWLDSIQRSASWRVTARLRAAKRAPLGDEQMSANAQVRPSTVVRREPRVYGVELAFVLAPRQNAFFVELVEALRWEAEALGVPTSLHIGIFPLPRPDLVYLLPARKSRP